ncbi:unnamed protein product [Anisakis simplex]|nr:unnamed protein product [Anisakis simplex]
MIRFFSGVHYMPLTSVQYSNETGAGKWLQIDQELETRNGQTIGTSRPTGHSLLVDVRFELPFDAQGSDAEELQAKLQALNKLIEVNVSRMCHSLLTSPDCIHS